MLSHLGALEGALEKDWIDAPCFMFPATVSSTMEEEGRMKCPKELKNGTVQEISSCWLPVICPTFYRRDLALH